MKKRLLTSIFVVLSVIYARAQPISIGGYNVYYGDLHNHSNLSDGTGSPSTAFNYARNTAHLDFFGLTDHSDYLNPSGYADIRNQANAYTQDGVFVGFYGFEWTSELTYGHLTVLNTDDFCTIDSPTTTFPDLLIWLASRPDGIGFFNHPGHFDQNGQEFCHFATAPSRQIVGMELWNAENTFTEFYYVNGYYSGDNKSYIDEANNRGWQVGAAGAGDDHWGTWGTARPYRLAVLSNYLSRADLLAAMRARRFYSTLDKNLALSFKIGNGEMGSTVPGATDTARIQAIDADHEIFNQVILYNKNHDVVNTWSLNTDTVNLRFPLHTTNGDYYYVKIREADGDEAISSPVWISEGTLNQFPFCSIINPETGTSATTPADITINANAIDADGSVSKVEFYSGTIKLGEDLTSPYNFSWSNIPPGTYILTVKATDNSGAVTTSLPVTFTVNARPVTVTADVKSKVYGTSDPVLTYRITSGSLEGSDTFTGSLNRSPGEDAGSYTIGQGTLSLNSNYTLTFIGSNLTITTRPLTITAESKTKVYGTTDPGLTYQITSGSLSGTDTFSGSLTRDAGENTGTFDITRGTLTPGSNYSLTYIGASLSITLRSVTVTADNVSRVYGDTEHLTYRVTSGSLAGTDSFTGSLARTPGENVGNYAISRGTLSLGSNYSITFIGANLVITSRNVTATADNISKFYANAELLTYHITSGSLAGSDTFAGSLTRATGENVGTYAISQGSLRLGPNYTLTFTGANLVIKARPVTVTADAASKIYGEADHLTYRITSGTLAGSDFFTGSPDRETGEDIGTYRIRQGTLALSSNYSLSWLGADLNIKPRPISASADPKTKVYGFSDPELTYRITSGTLEGSDSFTGSLSRDTGEDFGLYTIRKGSLDAGRNYAFTFKESTLTVEKEKIVITADPKFKTYGDSDPELTYSISEGSLVNGQEIGGELSRDAGECAGIYDINQGTLTVNNNYTLEFVRAGIEIRQRPLTVSADSKKKVYGESDPDLTFRVTSGSLAGGDGFSGSLIRKKGEDVGVYPISVGTLSLTTDYLLAFEGSDLSITAFLEILAYPNPFTDHICFELTLSHGAALRIDIFNQSGNLIANVFSGKVEANFYHIDYVPENVRSGLLIYQFTINGQIIRGTIVHI